MLNSMGYGLIILLSDVSLALLYLLSSSSFFSGCSYFRADERHVFSLQRLMSDKLTLLHCYEGVDIKKKKAPSASSDISVIFNENFLPCVFLSSSKGQGQLITNTQQYQLHIAFDIVCRIKKRNRKVNRYF